MSFKKMFADMSLVESIGAAEVSARACRADAVIWSMDGCREAVDAVTYESQSSYCIEGRGRVHTVINKVTLGRDALSEALLGSKVVIDGKVHTVKGLEGYATTEIMEGWPIGLLV